MTKEIIIPYFPKGLKYVTPLTFGAAIYLAIIGHPVWASLLVLISIIILTTKYVTAIDLREKKYKDYISFLWLP